MGVNDTRFSLCEHVLYASKRLVDINGFTVDDTIVAVASPLSPAPRGIVRMSGEGVIKILRRTNLIATDWSDRRTQRFASRLDLDDLLGAIDVDVMLWPTSRSYTGQPSAELHLIGSLPILDAVVDRLIAAGGRAARAGEFTMRSFLAGRLDLPQAEAVLGVIDAEDPSTLDQALSQLAGNLSRPLQTVRGELLNLLADVEAGLDFVDEDIEFIEDSDLIDRLGGLGDLLTLASDQLRERSASSSTLEIVLRGLPNAGKSCLLNALTQTESAIVTEQAGTTRDSISVSFEVEGYAVRVTDTAGIEWRAANDPDAEVLEKAQWQAIEAASRADLCLWCIDASEGQPVTALESLQGFAADAHSHKNSIENWVLLTKSDLVLGSPEWAEALRSKVAEMFNVSALTGDGMNELRNRIVGMAERIDATEVGSVIGTAARCRGSLMGAIEAINQAVDATRMQAGHELVATEIRTAAGLIGDVTGEVYTDDLLDRVFSRFCIGK
ncbi:tRNA modification GTPase [Rhodopirellula sp. SWK7]|uniref:tRNA modification GTPase n=1 Tax=Rhodopirellula sp. SWK7 TaxID=595460 RepID=UPI0002BDC6EC|nr:GTPase [Rhodopirellula sp. SWK7]EMI40519.1 tRNA modification GTPase TrmE [Rhodopirellula sp. SWK7]